jgi:hypothetical protein
MLELTCVSQYYRCSEQILHTNNLREERVVLLTVLEAAFIMQGGCREAVHTVVEVDQKQS